MNGATILDWAHLQDAPEAPGVYAWYVRMFLGDADLREFEEQIDAAREQEERPESVVLQMLQRHFFHPFRENAYSVRLSGALKPRYAGELMHEPTQSEDLLRRLAEQPARLRRISDMLGKAAPLFTAPLYIGMASSLRSRLGQHKRLIKQLSESPGALASDEGASGFARQVVNRGFIPNQLFIAYLPLPDILGDEQVDLENILNRINFPIFGRN
jgi:hypothetical protein